MIICLWCIKSFVEVPKNLYNKEPRRCPEISACLWGRRGLKSQDIDSVYLGCSKSIVRLDMLSSLEAGFKRM